MAEPGTPGLSRTDSFQYPSAHLGHLTEGQQAALDAFKKICEEEGYYHPAGSPGHVWASHDDETMLRYLRARRFTPSEAFKQFKETEEWRKEVRLEELYETIDIHDYEETRRRYPQWTGRRDRRGIPVYVFEVAHLDSKNIAAYEASLAKSATASQNASSKVPIKMLHLFTLYENLTRFVLPLCSAIKDRPHLETPVSQSSNIVDISRVGLRQFWNLKAHMQDASQLATAYYPETLDRIFIIGAPSFFPTVWSWIKRWFDPITVSKIFILSAADMKPTLEKYIDPANIPRKYGGTLDYEFGMLPILEPAIQDALTWLPSPPTDTSLDVQNGARTIPTGPIKWHEIKDGHMEATAVGSEAGKPRKRPIATVHSDLQGIHGVLRPVNTPIDWSVERVQTTTGTATQPSEDGDPLYGADLSSGVSTPVPGALPDRTVVASSAESGLSPSDATPRTGTSNSRLEAQEDTYAETSGVTKATPHDVNYGHGDKAATVETSTVGQGGKAVDLAPKSRGEEEAKGVIEQAEAVAAAVEVVAEKVGVAGSHGEENAEKTDKSENTPEEGPAATAGDRSVEAFLRDQYNSKKTAPK
ncbi:CRAL/TRIO domain-containing protein [Trichodelitschia bisporula]|uniref:CRAL/TRIO domain-containing protein n=1 Tax=Trichodelitschia bisporula TaxID=703511 RepID=A0A6G1HVA4_9PEZI|nr:CRAL/TRIO domain-containing protein [Trichodelitschia bisporula]